MQTVQSSLVRSSHGAQTRETTWINKSKVIVENMLHIPIKARNRRNTDMRVIFGSLGSEIYLLRRDIVFIDLACNENRTVLEEMIILPSQLVQKYIK